MDKVEFKSEIRSKLGPVSSESYVSLACDAVDALPTKYVKHQYAVMHRNRNYMSFTNEIVAAGCFAKRGAGVEAYSTPILDFVISPPRVGIEVKGGAKLVSNEIVTNLGLRELFGEIYGAGISVRIEYYGSDYPSSEDWGVLSGKLRRGRNDLNERIRGSCPDKLPHDRQMRINASLGASSGISIIVARVGQVSVSIDFYGGGGGWGIVSDRVVGHLKRKAGNTADDFCLLYVVNRNREKDISGSRVMWAWKEEISGFVDGNSRFDHFKGLLVVDALSGSLEKLKLFGVFRSEELSAGMKRFGVVDLASPEPSIVASSMWAEIRDKVVKHKTTDHEWHQLRNQIVKTDCSDQQAGVLYKSILNRAADLKTTRIPYFPDHDHQRFPCRPDQVFVFPRSTPPRGGDLSIEIDSSGRD